MTIKQLEEKKLTVAQKGLKRAKNGQFLKKESQKAFPSALNETKTVEQAKKMEMAKKKNNFNKAIIPTYNRNGNIAKTTVAVYKKSIGLLEWFLGYCSYAVELLQVAFFYVHALYKSTLQLLRIDLVLQFVLRLANVAWKLAKFMIERVLFFLALSPRGLKYWKSHTFLVKTLHWCVTKPITIGLTLMMTEQLIKLIDRKGYYRSKYLGRDSFLAMDKPWFDHVKNVVKTLFDRQFWYALKILYQITFDTAMVFLGNLFRKMSLWCVKRAFREPFFFNTQEEKSEKGYEKTQDTRDSWFSKNNNSNNEEETIWQFCFPGKEKGKKEPRKGDNGETYAEQMKRYACDKLDDLFWMQKPCENLNDQEKGQPLVNFARKMWCLMDAKHKKQRDGFVSQHGASYDSYSRNSGNEFKKARDSFKRYRENGKGDESDQESKRKKTKADDKDENYGTQVTCADPWGTDCVETTHVTKDRRWSDAWKKVTNFNFRDLFMSGPDTLTLMATETELLVMKNENENQVNIRFSNLGEKSLAILQKKFFDAKKEFGKTVVEVMLDTAKRTISSVVIGNQMYKSFTGLPLLQIANEKDFTEEFIMEAVADSLTDANIQGPFAPES
jgi:hypothetical protein